MRHKTIAFHHLLEILIFYFVRGFDSILVIPCPRNKKEKERAESEELISYAMSLKKDNMVKNEAMTVFRIIWESAKREDFSFLIKRRLLAALENISIREFDYSYFMSDVDKCRILAGPFPPPFIALVKDVQRAHCDQEFVDIASNNKLESALEDFCWYVYPFLKMLEKAGKFIVITDDFKFQNLLLLYKNYFDIFRVIEVISVSELKTLIKSMEKEPFSLT